MAEQEQPMEQPMEQPRTFEQPNVHPNEVQFEPQVAQYEPSFEETTDKSTIAWNLTNVLKLAGLIKDYPCLYNSKLKEYTKKSLKSEAVIEIASQMGTTVGEIYRKIKCLRTQFAREKTKVVKNRILRDAGLDVDAQSKWVYYTALSFLEDFTLVKATRFSRNLEATCSQELDAHFRNLHYGSGSPHETEYEAADFEYPTGEDHDNFPSPFGIACTIQGPEEEGQEHRGQHEFIEESEQAQHEDKNDIRVSKNGSLDHDRILMNMARDAHERMIGSVAISNIREHVTNSMANNDRSMVSNDRNMVSNERSMANAMNNGKHDRPMSNMPGNSAVNHGTGRLNSAVAQLTRNAERNRWGNEKAADLEETQSSFWSESGSFDLDSQDVNESSSKRRKLLPRPENQSDLPKHKQHTFSQPAPPSDSNNYNMNEDEAFTKFVCSALHKIKEGKMKRKLKRQIVDSIFEVQAALEENDDL